MTFYAHMLNESVTVEPVNTLGEDGQPVYGAGVTRDVYIERRTSVLSEEFGFTASVDTGLIAESEIAKGSRVTLPDGSTMQITETGEMRSTDDATSIYVAGG